MSQVVGLPNNSYKPITNTAWVRARLCKLQKKCTRLAVASDKVYQLLAHSWWFSPGTPTSSATKTGHHDIAEILLKVVLNTIKISGERAIGIKIMCPSGSMCYSRSVVSMNQQYKNSTTCVGLVQSGPHIIIIIIITLKINLFSS